MTDVFNINDRPFNPDYILITDEKAAGTAGGTFTSGAWQTRDLNTIVSDVGGHASVSSNQVTLPAGNYRFKGSGSAFDVGSHKVRLQNITDATTVETGTSESALDSDNGYNKSFVFGKFTITTSKIFELQHRCSITQATNGFGLGNAGIGATETFGVIEFFKEA